MLDKQYLDTIKLVLSKGEEVTGRNGNVLQYFSPPPIVVESVEKQFPILQCRKIPFYKSALETLFFLSGNTAYLAMPEVLRESWWKPWSEQAKLQKSWGKFYGHQLRSSQTENVDKNFDQWNYLRDSIKESLETGEVNRRLVISLWRLQDTLSEFTNYPAVLGSCHSTALVFNLNPVTRVLDLQHTQRSADLLCGVGSNLIYSGLLMKLLAEEFGLIAGKLVYQVGNCHIYSSHCQQAGKLSVTEDLPIENPTVKVLDYDNFFCQTISDVKNVFTLVDYNPSLTNYKFELIG